MTRPAHGPIKPIIIGSYGILCRSCRMCGRASATHCPAPDDGPEIPHPSSGRVGRAGRAAPRRASRWWNSFPQPLRLKVVAIGLGIANGQKPTVDGVREFSNARSAPKSAPCRRAVRHRLSYPMASRRAEYRRRTHAGWPAGSDEATHHAGRAGPAADRQSITRASWPTRSELSGGPASVARYPPG
jgi:hypothetical protein